MAELVRDYHNDLQEKDLQLTDDLDAYARCLQSFLREIPEQQQLQESGLTAMNWKAKRVHIAKALKLTKNGSATGMDGCPYELWRALDQKFETAAATDEPGFDIAKTLTDIFNDIQEHGVDPCTNFTLGWMCPIYKKKDPTDISNYRPITLLNTDYKLLTKVLALQLLDHVRELIHPDQTGFIPKWSIFDHIRLARAIISYTDLTEENGAIIALDQEKAYDKIRHDYLWETLRAFNLPEPFIQTIRSLYQNAETVVAINGVFSSSFRVTRRVRQGDPLSCPIFNLAIEPLACKIRNDNTIHGLRIPGLVEKLVIKIFADDTSLYLSNQDRFDHIQTILDDWCAISGAKFNIDKTEIIPVGSENHRQNVITRRKINPLDNYTFPNRIRIAQEGEATRILGAWVGNNADAMTPWEPIIDKINHKLKNWDKLHPTLDGRRLIIQTVIGGHTQFLTQAQGMPDAVEKTLNKITTTFMWSENSSPRIALNTLQKPIEDGGLSLLNINARNEAIDIMWLKAYLNFTPSRPTWAAVTDIIISAIAPPATIKELRINPFLQCWNAPTRGPRAHKLNGDIIRLLKVAKKYNANLAAIRMTEMLRAQLPAWYHPTADPYPINNRKAKCLIEKHKALNVADLMTVSTWLRNPEQLIPHRNETQCPCTACVNDRIRGCTDPSACATEALIRIHKAYPKYNPLRPGDPHDNLSLTKTRKVRNDDARQNDNLILFDPSITTKTSLADCFRVFTDPNRISKTPAQRHYAPGIRLRCRPL